ncbi:MAG: sigma-70 family RNA polymerase sigma factor [Planctomycetales bacterium]|nr:sigma-70 family RNA polymerase sigma factor [Planctomycetales bacterium]MCA9169403.1 sigma-70 family RNA polymerase sigma factor [Planctomycetales bacterium]
MESPDSSQGLITQILSRPDGDSRVAEELFPLVYQELRNLAAARIAKEAPGQTLQATALVHEAYIRLVDADVKWDSRRHFFAAAARSMRQILINRAIRKQAKKHGGDRDRQEFDEAIFASEPPPQQVLALNAALERLEALDERKGQVVMLRYFAGLSIEDTAAAMGLSPATIKREWQFARTWLHREMTK